MLCVYIPDCIIKSFDMNTSEGSILHTSFSNDHWSYISTDLFPWFSCAGDGIFLNGEHHLLLSGLEYSHSFIMGNINHCVAIHLEREGGGVVYKLMTL